MQYVAMFFLILMLIFAQGCGKQIVPDKVTVEHKVTVENLEPYLREYCSTQFPEDPVQVEQCVALEIGKFLSIVNNID